MCCLMPLVYIQKYAKLLINEAFNTATKINNSLINIETIL